MHNDKKNKERKKGKAIPNAKKFSSTYQPSPEAKSKGQKKKYEYEKARQQFFEKLCEIKLPNGEVVNFFDYLSDQLQEIIVMGKDKMMSKDRAELILKLCKEFMPETKLNNISSERPIIIKLSEKDSKL